MDKTRIIIRTTALVLVLIAIFTTTAAALSCDCGEICVNQTGWWRDGGAFNASGTPIQAAVDDATAGETIFVWNGSYTENVDITTAHLTLEGEGAGVVTVTANQSSDHVFNVTADYVNISGFTATGATGTAKAGIYLDSADHCNISENNCSNNYAGIYLHSSSSNNTLTGNTANSNYDDGIHLYYSSNNTLTGNTANSNDDYGIYLEYSSNNTLTGNTASSNGDYGIRLSSSSNNNTLTGNTANSNYDGDGIRLSSSSNNNTLTGNTANSNDGNGICLSSSSNNTLANNTASSNDGGIHLNNADDNNITCNWVHNNTDTGFYLRYGSTGNTIESNNIIANGVYNDTSDGYEWQFMNDQPDDVNTAGNWWGTNNETRINASIHDWTYNTVWGNVTTDPKLDGAVPCAPIPELPTIALIAVGLLMLAGYVRVGRRK